MNKFISVLTLPFFAAPAMGEELSKVEALRTIELREGDLRVSYVTGGGCREHSAKFAMTIKEDDKKKYVATLTVMDSTDEPDTCDAVVEVSGTANLKDLLKKEAARQKIDPAKLGDIQIELPKVTVQ